MYTDVSRLPAVLPARTATGSARSARAVPSPEPDTRVTGVERRARAAETHDRVVHGELLQRQRNPLYQSTRAFIEERNLTRARPSENPPVALQQQRQAANRYVAHAPAVPEAAAPRTISTYA